VKQEGTVPEVFVETIPFVVGAVLGFLTIADRAIGANVGWIAGGSIVAGGLCSALAGELGQGFLTAAIAVFADSAAVAIGWVGAQLAMRHGRSLLRRT